MAFETRHDAETLGPLLAEPEHGAAGGAELLSVVDLVHQVASARRLSPAAAVQAVAKRLDRASALFLTRPRQWAQRIDDGHEWEPRREGRPASVRTEVRARPSWSATAWGGTQPQHLVRSHHVAGLAARPGRYGVTGALELLRLTLGVEADSAEGRKAAVRHADKLRRLALLVSDARAIFADLTWSAHEQIVATDTAAADVGTAAPAVVQPEGGQWPHRKGSTWTDAERAALFLMRHRDKRTGKELAEIAGCSRQMIDAVIGPERAHGGLDTIVAKSKGWRPSPQLLAECGQPLQPLQSAALTLARS